MKKQPLNEEFKRMQRLAGIITESYLDEANGEDKVQQYMKNGDRENLDINNTEITELPSGLNVKGSLDISNTKIAKLPSDLKIGGNLYARNTPLSKSHTIEQIKQMVSGIRGSIMM